MTLYKLLSHRTMQNKEEKVSYFMMDVNWLFDTLDKMEVDYGEWRKVAENASEKIKNDRELNEREKKIWGVIFSYDSEWIVPLSEWIHGRFFRSTLEFMGGSTNRKAMDIAREFGNVEELTFPDFTRPDEHSVDGENPMNFISSFSQSALLANSLLQLEWLEEVTDQLGIQVDQELIDETYQNTLYLLTKGENNLREREKKFMRTMNKNTLIWIKDTERTYRFRSYMLWRLSKEIKNVNDRELS